MKVLLTSNASYAPPRGGSTRGNLAWLRHLASAGHAVTVVATGDQDAGNQVDGVAIHSVHDLPRRSAILSARIRDLQPDWVLVSSEDLSHVLLREAGAAAPGRVVYLAHTPQFFPFGPESWNRDEKAAAVVRRACAVVAIGHHMAGYIAEHAGVPARVIHPPIYGNPPWPRFGRFEGGSVLMINPCRVKGVGIFAALAGEFPGRPFEALAGWGTTTADRRLLSPLANVRLSGTVANIDEVLARASVLLMPSIWYEGFGLIAMEAMLRGVPVIASDSGGLKEAMQGSPFVIPVRAIERYRAEFDETHMPVPEEPAQEIEPWAVALRTLLSDRRVYDEEARRARESAVRFVSALRASDLESMLAGLTPRLSDALLELLRRRAQARPRA